MKSLLVWSAAGNYLVVVGTQLERLLCVLKVSKASCFSSSFWFLFIICPCAWSIGGVFVLLWGLFTSSVVFESFTPFHRFPASAWPVWSSRLSESTSLGKQPLFPSKCTTTTSQVCACVPLIPADTRCAGRRLSCDFSSLLQLLKPLVSTTWARTAPWPASSATARPATRWRAQPASGLVSYPKTTLIFGKNSTHRCSELTFIFRQMCFAVCVSGSFTKVWGVAVVKPWQTDQGCSSGTRVTGFASEAR